MAEHPGPGTVQSSAGGPARQAPGVPSGRPTSTPGAYEEHEAFHGRPVSWVAVTVVFIGSIIGGSALVAGPTWWLFWVGLGIFIAGGIMALFISITDDWY